MFILDTLITSIMYITYQASLKKSITYELQEIHDKFWKYDKDTYDFSNIETTVWRIPYYYELLFYGDYFSIKRIRDLIKHKTKITIRNANTVMDNKLYIFKRYTFLFTIIKNIDKVYGYKLVFNFYLKKNYYEE